MIDAACVGAPDREMGERLVALVELAPGARPPTATPCSRSAASELAGYKCPKELRFVDTLPRNPMGKIDKKALRAAL